MQWVQNPMRAWELFGSFPKLGRVFGGVPIVRIIKYSGLYWGPPVLGDPHLCYHVTEAVREEDHQLARPLDEREASMKAMIMSSTYSV